MITERIFPYFSVSTTSFWVNGCDHLEIQTQPVFRNLIELKQGTRKQ